MKNKTRFQMSVAIRRSLLQDTGAEDYCTLFDRLIARLRCMGSVTSQKITAHGVCLLLGGARCPDYNGVKSDYAIRRLMDRATSI